ELAERHVDIPEQVVSVGEEITVKVIDIDLDRRRISLSLKQAVQEGEQAQAADAGQGEQAGDDTLENIVEDLKRKNAGE
ncbi:MAG TPA: S1 RNA-binding domain-containing protein, partial [Actinomycetota bacterium]|nr:S1 RNA-binding domain-containing protein [Actinomycetota bacterium]